MSYAQNIFVDEIELSLFLKENDSLITQISELEVPEEDSKLKVYLYRLRYSSEGFDRIESREVFYLGESFTSFIFNKQPIVENPFGWENDQIVRRDSDDDDRKMIVDLQKLEGFYLQGIFASERKQYPKDNISLMLFFENSEPKFGYIKFGPNDLFPEYSKLSVDDVGTLKRFYKENFVY